MPCRRLHHCLPSPSCVRKDHFYMWTPVAFPLALGEAWAHSRSGGDAGQLMPPGSSPQSRMDGKVVQCPCPLGRRILKYVDYFPWVPPMYWALGVLSSNSLENALLLTSFSSLSYLPTSLLTFLGRTSQINHLLSNPCFGSVSEETTQRFPPLFYPNSSINPEDWTEDLYGSNILCFQSNKAYFNIQLKLTMEVTSNCICPDLPRSPLQRHSYSTCWEYCWPLQGWLQLQSSFLPKDIHPFPRWPTCNDWGMLGPGHLGPSQDNSQGAVLAPWDQPKVVAGPTLHSTFPSASCFLPILWRWLPGKHPEH